MSNGLEGEGLSRSGSKGRVNTYTCHILMIKMKKKEKRKRRKNRIEFRIFIVKFNSIFYNEKLFFLLLIKILLSLLIQNIGHFPKTF